MRTWNVATREDKTRVNHLLAGVVPPRLLLFTNRGVHATTWFVRYKKLVEFEIENFRISFQLSLNNNHKCFEMLIALILKKKVAGKFSIPRTSFLLLIDSLSRIEFIVEKFKNIWIRYLCSNTYFNFSTRHDVQMFYRA